MSREYVQSLARGLAVLKSFSPAALERSVSDVAVETGLARPTVRRLLLTLEQLGYVHRSDGLYSLTTKSLELGTSYVSSLGMWDVAREHLEDLVARTGEATGMTQMDGSDIVCIAIVGAPKIIAVWAHVGTRFPAVVTAPGKVMLADLEPAEVARVLKIPSRADFSAEAVQPTSALMAQLAAIKAQGWALADEELTRGLRAIAAPIRDSSGRTVAAVNVATHVREVSIERLMNEFLPVVVGTADMISSEWAKRDTVS